MQFTQYWSRPRFTIKQAINDMQEFHDHLHSHMLSLSTVSAGSHLSCCPEKSSNTNNVESVHILSIGNFFLKDLQT